MEKIILDYLQQNEGFHSKGNLYLLAEKEEYSFEYLGRTCRQLAEQGLINVDYYKGKRGQTLARYARLNTEKPQIIKPLMVEKDGVMFVLT